MKTCIVLIAAGMAFASSAIAHTATVYCARYPGTDASRKLAACFAALPATGGVADATGITGVQTLSFDPFQGVSKPIQLLLGAARYDLRAGLHLPTQSQIIGAGIDKTILREADGVSLPIALEIMPDSTGWASSVTLSGFTLDLNGQNNRGPGQIYAIKMGRIKNGIVKGIIVQNSYGLYRGTSVGLAVNQGFHVTVTQSRFLNLGAFPMNTAADHQSDAVYAAGDQIAVTNNTFDHITDTGIVTERATNADVDSNLIQNSVQGVAVSAPLPYWITHDVRVIANRFVGMNHWNGEAIMVWGVENSAHTGKTTRNVQVENNTVIGSTQGAGMIVMGAQNVDLRDNVVDSMTGDMHRTFRSGRGIIVVRSDSVTLAGNVVRKANANGIEVRDSRQITLLDNTVEYSGWTGMLLRNAQGFYLEKNRFNSSSQLKSGGISGVSIDAVDGTTSDGTLIGNQSTSANSPYGIAVYSGVRIQLTSNDCRFNQRAGIWVNSALPVGSVTLRGNYQ
jgi:parallel beta-helix repeat protein